METEGFQGLILYLQTVLGELALALLYGQMCRTAYKVYSKTRLLSIQLYTMPHDDQGITFLQRLADRHFPGRYMVSWHGEWGYKLWQKGRTHTGHLKLGIVYSQAYKNLEAYLRNRMNGHNGDSHQ